MGVNKKIWFHFYRAIRYFLSFRSN